MAKLNAKKVVIVGGLVAGGIFLLNKLSKTSARAAELEQKVEAQAKEQAAAGEDKQSIIATLLQHPKVQERVAKVGTGATTLVKSLLSKIGVS